jgi:haloalkane dehalogenase
MSWVDREAWPWEGRMVDVGEGRMCVTEVGQGPPVLLVHGTPTWSFEWRHVIRELSKTHRCIAPDHLGFGLSDRPAGAGYRPEDHARRLARLVDALGLEHFTLVVHDYGGPIGLPLAFAPGKVDRIVILNTWMWDFSDDPGMRRAGWLAGSWLFRMFYKYLNFSVRVLGPSAWGDRKKLTPAIQAQYLAPWPDPDGRERVLWALAYALLGSGAFYRSLWDQREKLRALPALVVWGLKDSAFQPHQLAKWRQVLPDAKVVELPGAGHWPHEEEPEAVISALRDFLRAS